MNPQLYEWDNKYDLENCDFQQEQSELLFDELIMRKKGVQNG